MRVCSVSFNFLCYVNDRRTPRSRDFFPFDLANWSLPECVAPNICKVFNEAKSRIPKLMLTRMPCKAACAKGDAIRSGADTPRPAIFSARSGLSILKDSIPRHECFQPSTTVFFSPLLPLSSAIHQEQKKYIAERGMIYSRRVERNKGARMKERKRERKRETEAMVLRHNTNVYDFST